MAELVKVGNSFSVRIPKPLIEQAHLKDRELELRVTEEGLLIVPKKKKVREGWAELCRKMRENGDDEIIGGDIVNEFDEKEWVW